MVSSDQLDEWVHELRVRALVCRAEAERFGEVVVMAHCDDVLARLDVVRVDSADGEERDGCPSRPRVGVLTADLLG